MKINFNLIEKYKNMLEISDFEQDCYSRTAEGVYMKSVMIVLE